MKKLKALLLATAIMGYLFSMSAQPDCPKSGACGSGQWYCAITNGSTGTSCSGLHDPE